MQFLQREHIPQYCTGAERANGGVFFFIHVQLPECRHKAARELDLILYFCHVSLTKAEGGTGVECVRREQLE